MVAALKNIKKRKLKLRRKMLATSHKFSLRPTNETSSLTLTFKKRLSRIWSSRWKENFQVSLRPTFTRPYIASEG